ncbi:MAG: response regulator [Treponema sp.]|jgi:CheY-like chemotaxis protein/nitrogen-specific signal transduction histidine kinase|nr:response regulator [Treponema sp.]
MACFLSAFSLIFSLLLLLILIRINAARKKSDLESKYKSAFLANMSHEIRTPMNTIIGMTNIGKSNSDIEHKDYCFSKIDDASHHLLGIINNILDMSKIEANKFDIISCDFNLEKMLQRVVNVINFRVDEKKLNFTVYIDRFIPKILEGDEQRIAQVITNLLGNAVKFTPENGSVHLDARLIDEQDDVCNIQFSVSDTGIGVSSSQKDRIFNSFEQAEKNTVRKYGGTGLGLSISKSIVELMGGKIWMLSEINKGSTFIFTVPLKRGIQQSSELLTANVNLDNIRILVVDDDNDVLDYFKEISNEFKIHCSIATNAIEAIQLIEKNEDYHLYFIDWKMPGIDGIELSAMIKARSESEKSIVIMITSAEWTTIEKEAREAGVNKFISKPVFPSSIADIVSETIGIDHRNIESVKTDINGMFLGRRILLVDDMEINRQIVAALLDPTQIEIDNAENGKEAIQMFLGAPGVYDLILMDIQMPEMDGYEATRYIRGLNLPQAKQIPIIAMTANVFREDIEKSRKAGMDNHLCKPLDNDDVIHMLSKYLSTN